MKKKEEEKVKKKYYYKYKYFAVGSIKYNKIKKMWKEIKRYYYYLSTLRLFFVE